jgi:hypothetical protein
MSKFKTGDRVKVVLVKYPFDEPEYIPYVGKYGMVQEDDEEIPRVCLDGGEHVVFYQDELEFTEIADSPLYKTLEEK